MASVRKHRGRWQLRWRDPLGRERSSTFTAKRDALKAKTQIESQLQLGVWLDPSKGQRTSFGELADLWQGRMQSRLRPGTFANYEIVLRRYVRPEFGRHPVGSIDAEAVLRWVTGMEQAGVGPHPIARSYAVMSRVLDLGVELGVIGSNVMPKSRDVRPSAPSSKPDRFLTVEDVEKLAEAIDPRYRCWVYVAAYCGMRWGEIAGLKVKHVDLLHAEVRVEEQQTTLHGKVSTGAPKTEAGRRVIALPRFLTVMLAEQIADKLPEALVFTSPGGGPLRLPNFRSRVWLPALRAAGLPATRIHDLRHTAVSLLAAEGVPAHEIAERLGHTDARFTFTRYSHVLPSRRGEAAEALDRMREAHLR
jgi:integrase